MKKYSNIFNTPQAQLSPVQVRVRSETGEDFHYAAKLFKTIVQKEKILAFSKEFGCESHPTLKIKLDP